MFIHVINYTIRIRPTDNIIVRICEYAFVDNYKHWTNVFDPSVRILTYVYIHFCRSCFSENNKKSFRRY